MACRSPSRAAWMLPVGPTRSSASTVRYRFAGHRIVWAGRGGVVKCFTFAEWVLRRQQWPKLVGVVEESEMRAFAPYIGGREHNVGGQFLLHVQVPLLYVRPYRLIRYGNDRKRKERYRSTTRADILITDDVRLRRGKHEWRAAFQ